MSRGVAFFFWCALGVETEAKKQIERTRVASIDTHRDGHFFFFMCDLRAEVDNGCRKKSLPLPSVPFFLSIFISIPSFTFPLNSSIISHRQSPIPDFLQKDIIHTMAARQSITCYYDVVSPYSYLGVLLLNKLKAGPWANVDVELKPFFLHGIMRVRFLLLLLF